MPKTEERAAVVAEARRWIGTPYHNCADLHGIGVDCGMLIVRVFVDTGLCAPFDPRPYPPDWHLHRSDERYLGFVFDRCAEVEEPRPGDILVFRYGRCYSHGGIVTTAIAAYHRTCVLACRHRYRRRTGPKRPARRSGTASPRLQLLETMSRHGVSAILRQFRPRVTRNIPGCNCRHRAARFRLRSAMAPIKSRRMLSGPAILWRIPLFRRWQRRREGWRVRRRLVAYKL